MSPAARETLIDQNFMSLGMGLIETGMARFWSDERVKNGLMSKDLPTLIMRLAAAKG